MKLILSMAIIAMGSLYSQEFGDAKTDLKSEPNFSITSEDLSKTSNPNRVSYGYVKASSHGIYPGLGLGYRRHGMHGFNVDFSAYKYEGVDHSLYGKGHYLFYPKQDHFYLGCGAGCIGAYIGIYGPATEYIVLPTLEGIVGYEWKSGRVSSFLQVEVGGIPYDSYSMVPLPSLSFGIGF